MHGIRGEIREYLQKNMGIYILIVILFCAGVLAGAFLVRDLGNSQNENLHQYFDQFVEACLENNTSEGRAILGQSIKINFQYLFFIWASGLLMLGFPVTMALISWRGFSVGFAVGFLVKRSALRGMLFALGSILPHSLFIIPALVIISVTGFTFSWGRFKSYLEKKPYPVRKNLFPYTIIIALLGFVLFAGCLIEAYISPVFIKLLAPLL